MADYALMTLAMTAYLTLLVREKTNTGSNCRITFFTLESYRDLAVIDEDYPERQYAQSLIGFEENEVNEKEVVESKGLVNHMGELGPGET